MPQLIHLSAARKIILPAYRLWVLPGNHLSEAGTGSVPVLWKYTLQGPSALLAFLGWGQKV